MAGCGIRQSLYGYNMVGFTRFVIKKKEEYMAVLTFLVGLIIGLIVLFVYSNTTTPASVCSRKRSGELVQEHTKQIKRRKQGDYYVECDGHGHIQSSHFCKPNEYFDPLEGCTKGDRCTTKNDGFVYSKLDNLAQYFRCAGGNSLPMVCELGTVFDNQDKVCVDSDRCKGSKALELLHDKKVLFCDKESENQHDCKLRPGHPWCSCVGKRDRTKTYKDKRSYYECRKQLPQIIRCLANETVADELTCQNPVCSNKAEGEIFEYPGGYATCINRVAQITVCNTGTVFDPESKGCKSNQCISEAPGYKYESALANSYYECNSAGEPVLKSCGKKEVLKELSCTANVCYGLEKGSKVKHPVPTRYYVCDDDIREEECDEGEIFDNGACKKPDCTHGELSPHPSSHVHFYRCKNGVLNVEHCGYGNYFEQSCVPNPCHKMFDTFIADTTSPFKYIECLNRVPIKRECQAGEIFVSGVPCVKYTCDGTIVKSRISDDSYVVCGAIPVVVKCNPDQWLDESIECVANECLAVEDNGTIVKEGYVIRCLNHVPRVERCPGNEVILEGRCQVNVCTQANVSLPHASDQTLFIKCVNSVPSIHHCPFRHYFKEASCVLNECYTSTNKILPVPSKSRYTECINGFPVERSCLDGEFFDGRECKPNICKKPRIAFSETQFYDCTSGIPILTSCPRNTPVFEGDRCVVSPCISEGDIITQLEFGTTQDRYRICYGNIPKEIECKNGYFNGKGCAPSFCPTPEAGSDIPNVYFECVNNSIISRSCKPEEYLSGFECKPNICLSKPVGAVIEGDRRNEYYVCRDGVPLRQECKEGEFFSGEGCEVNGCVGKSDAYTFPDTNDDANYYKCVSGYPVISTCPANTYFKESRCVAAGCSVSDTFIRVVDDPFSYFDCVRGTTLRCAPDTYFVGALCVPNICSRQTGKLPHADITSFIDCSSGIPKTYKCQPEDSYFDLTIHACQPNPCVDSSNAPAVISPRSYYDCKDRPTLVACESDRYYNRDSRLCEVNPCLVDAYWTRPKDDRGFFQCEGVFPAYYKCPETQYAQGTVCVLNKCFSLPDDVDIPLEKPSKKYIGCRNGLPTELTCDQGQYFRETACVDSPCLPGRRTAAHDTPTSYLLCQDGVPHPAKCPGSRIYSFGRDSCIPNICKGRQRYIWEESILSDRYTECVGGFPVEKTCDSPGRVFIRDACKPSPCVGKEKVKLDNVIGSEYYDCTTEPPVKRLCPPSTYFKSDCVENVCVTKKPQPIQRNYYKCALSADGTYPIDRECDQGQVYVDGQCQVNTCSTGFFTIKHKPKLFFRCVNGVPEKTDCSPGQYWDGLSCLQNVCEHTTSSVADQSDPQKFYDCENNIPVSRKCPDELYYVSGTCRTNVCLDPNGRFPDGNLRGHYNCRNSIPTHTPCPGGSFYCTNHKYCHTNTCVGNENVKDITKLNGYLKCVDGTPHFIECESNQVSLGSGCIPNPCLAPNFTTPINATQFYSCRRGFPEIETCPVVFMHGRCQSKNPCVRETQRIASELSVFDYYQCMGPTFHSCPTGQFFLEPIQGCLDNVCDGVDSGVRAVDRWREGRVFCNRGTPDVRVCPEKHYYSEEACKLNVCDSGKHKPIRGGTYNDCSTGYPVVTHCPESRYFNYELQVCLDNICADGRRHVWQEPPLYTVCEELIPVQRRCLQGEMYTGDPLEPCGTDPCYGKKGLVAHKEYNKFYDCDTFDRRVDTCVKVFDPTLNRCADSVCLGLQDSTLVANEENPNQFYVCKDNLPIVRHCPTSKIFNRHTKECENTRCVNNPSYPDDSDSRYYYVCEPEVKREMCAEGKIYNPETFECFDNPCTGASGKVPSKSLSGFFDCGRGSKYVECSSTEYFRIDRCVDNPCLLDQNATHADPLRSDGFLTCRGTTPVENKCGTIELFFDNSCQINLCEGKANGETVAHHSDSTKYVICVNNMPWSTEECERGKFYLGDKCVSEVCKPNEMWPHEDKTKFHRCKDNAVSIEQCSAGKFFHIETGCRWNRCEGEPNNYVYADKTDITRFYKCDNGTPTLMRCGAGTFFNSRSCVDNECGGKYEGFRFRHANSTDLFYSCSQGIPNRQTCPSGRIFLNGFCVPEPCAGKSDRTSVYLTGTTYAECHGGRSTFNECSRGSYYSTVNGACVPQRCQDRKFKVNDTTYAVCDEEDVAEIACPSNTFVQIDKSSPCVPNPCIGGEPSYPHEDVTKFYECVLGIPVTRSCGYGKIFAHSGCVVNLCRRTVANKTLDHSSFVSCATREPKIVKCREGEVYVEEIGACRVCPTSGKLALAPSMYLECHDGGHVVVVCPSGKLFDGTRCTSGFCSGRSGRYANPHNSKQYYECVNDILTVRDCRDNRTYIEGACIVDPCARMTNGTIVKLGSGKFVECQYETAKLFDCPKGYTFVAEDGYCVRDKCDTVDQFAHDTNPLAYYTCAGGIIAYSECDPGKIYVEALRQCVNGPCSGQVPVQSPFERDAYYSCPSNKRATCDSSSQFFDERTRTCKINPCVNNPGKSVRVGIRGFYECTQREVTGALKTCSPTDYYSEQDQLCLFNPCLYTTSRYVRHDKDPHLYYRCRDSIPKLQTCGDQVFYKNTCTSADPCADTNFDQNYDRNLFPCAIGRPEEYVCVGGRVLIDKTCVVNECLFETEGYKFAHPFSPTEYLECVSDTPVKRQCFEGTVFLGECIESPCMLGESIVNDYRNVIICENGGAVPTSCPVDQLNIDGVCVPSGCTEKIQKVQYKHNKYFDCSQKHIFPCPVRFSYTKQACVDSGCVTGRFIERDRADSSIFYACKGSEVLSEFQCIDPDQTISLDTGVCISTPCPRLDTRYRLDRFSYYICGENTVETYTCQVGQYWSDDGFCKLDECAGNDYVVDKLDQSRYVVCSDGMFESAERCPENYIFYVKESQCIPARCEGRNLAILDSPNDFVNCVGRPAVSECPLSAPIFNAFSAVCEEERCAEGVEFSPIKGDARYYADCRDEETVRACPAGLKFLFGNCVDACFEDVDVYMPLGDGNFYKCAKGEPIQMRCGEGQYPTSDGVCLVDPCGQINLPFQTNPRMYRECENGKTVAVSRCEENYRYSRNKQSCVINRCGTDQYALDDDASVYLKCRPELEELKCPSKEQIFDVSLRYCIDNVCFAKPDGHRQPLGITGFAECDGGIPIKRRCRADSFFSQLYNMCM